MSWRDCPRRCWFVYCRKMSCPMECQLINIDWFSFSVILPLSESERLAGHATLNCPDGFSIAEYKGTNLYRRRCIVFDEDGSKVLTLLLEPFSPVLNPNSMFVEVANAELYRPFEWVLDFLSVVHLFSFQSLSRLDICCDFNPNVQQWSVIDGLQASIMYVAGKREGSMFYDYVLPVAGGLQKRVARCMSWGSKAANIHWKLYNKTLEIYEYDSSGHRWCTKPYIENHWLANGFDIENVWRLEVSITSAANFSWRGSKLDFAVNARSMFESLFYDIYQYRFVVRANQGHKCRKWDDVIPFLTIPNPDSALRLRRCEPLNERMSVDHAATLRACMKQLERDEVRYNADMCQLWLTTAENVISIGRLEGYFYRTYGKSFEDYAVWLSPVIN